jgi:hypothetical protein
MLKNSFLHIPGIGAETEKKFWGKGIRSWDSFNHTGQDKSPTKKEAIIGEYLLASKQHLQDGDPRFFADLMPAGQHWRFFPEFRKSAVFLDIETSGLDVCFGEISTIAMYDGREIFTYVNGENLDQFKTDIKKYDLIISYNGKCFDVPFIQDYMGITLNHAHIDLRYVLAGLGFKGGLKRCEKAMGIDRGDLSGVDGYFAVHLWNDYKQTKDLKTLETLLAYNVEDVVNLEILMVAAYNQNLAATPFSETQRLPSPSLPEIPFVPHMPTVERIKRKIENYYFS